MLRLEELVHTDRNSRIHDWSGKNYTRDDLFIKPLEIDKILDYLFHFRLGKTKKVAINIIRDLDFDPSIRIDRQELMKYIIEHEDLDKIISLTGEYFGNREMHKEHRLDPWIKRDRRDINSYFNPSVIEAHKEHIEEQMNLLGRISSLTKDSIMGKDSLKLIEEIKNSHWYKEAERVLPLSKEDYKRLSEITNTYREQRNGERKFKIETDYDYVDLAYILPRVGISRFARAFDYFTGYAVGFNKLKEEGANLIFPIFREFGGSETYKCCDIKGGVNFMLYMGNNKDKEKVANDFFSDEAQPILLITGENEYGKTMFLKTRGVIQAFATAGLPVIAESAELSHLQTILANIGVTEDSMKGISTYKAINDTTYNTIALNNRTRGLVLLDEPTGGTYDLKAEKQGKEFIEALAKIGLEAWIVTHHLRLAELEKIYPGVVNYSTEFIDGTPTYRIVPGIFEPEEHNVRIDYNAVNIMNSIKARPKHRQTQLRNLLKNGDFPEERRYLLEKSLERE